MKRIVILLPVLFALQVGVQPALAWAWPVDGPVLRPFVLGDDPYAGGQHRGVDIGAPAGTPVRAPAAGTVSFAGTVPTGGKTITIRTADGYAATLQRLGSTSLSPGLAVREETSSGRSETETSPTSTWASAKPTSRTATSIRSGSFPRWRRLRRRMSKPRRSPTPPRRPRTAPARGTTATPRRRRRP